MCGTVKVVMYNAYFFHVNVMNVLNVLVMSPEFLNMVSFYPFALSSSVHKYLSLTLMIYEL
jgi:hypothetical protein